MSAKEASGVIAREGTKTRTAGERLAASYVNFYIANGGVVMPLLDSRADRVAARRLKRLFPERRVVGVPARKSSSAAAIFTAVPSSCGKPFETAAGAPLPLADKAVRSTAF